jgi:hypothetical protein
MFMKLAPDAVGHDYLVMGTTERAFWKEGVDSPHSPTELLDNLHGFKDYLNFELVRGWLPDESSAKIATISKPSGGVDNVKNSQRLVAEIQANSPISARASKDLLKMLRKQGLPISDRQTLLIKSVFYGGDEMGIACNITPPGKHKQVVICSLTQLEIIGTSTLLDEMRICQEVRKKKLAQLPDSAPGSITIRRK